MSMDAAPPSRRERKQRATRRQLQLAAQTLFAERGYDGATMDDIAIEADVSRATAFNYFPRKEEFVLAWVAERRAMIEDLLSREQSDSGEVTARLRRVFMALCDSAEADVRATKALTRAWVHAGGPLLPEAFATAVLFADTLREAQADGHLRSDVDPDVAGQVLLDTYLGVFLRWAARDDERGAPPLHHQLSAALDIVIDGLRHG